MPGEVPALRRAADPCGEHNGASIIEACIGAKVVLCAWGAHAMVTHNNRDAEVLRWLVDATWCTGVSVRQRGREPWHTGLRVRRLGSWTKAGHPRHPLYLSSKTPLRRIRYWCPRGPECDEIRGHACALCYPGAADDDLPLLDALRRLA